MTLSRLRVMQRVKAECNETEPGIYVEISTGVDIDIVNGGGCVGADPDGGGETRGQNFSSDCEGASADHRECSRKAIFRICSETVFSEAIASAARARSFGPAVDGEGWLGKSCNARN